MTVRDQVSVAGLRNRDAAFADVIKFGSVPCRYLDLLDQANSCEARELQSARDRQRPIWYHVVAVHQAVLSGTALATGALSHPILAF